VKAHATVEFGLQISSLGVLVDTRSIEAHVILSNTRKAGFCWLWNLTDSFSHIHHNSFTVSKLLQFVVNLIPGVIHRLHECI
jgi:hypothetical protein